jgi:DNA mismatch endonuclease, patch repair protein
MKILRSNGITGWRRHLPLPGKPDFAFRSARLAVFVDGCFWHSCPTHGRRPDSNQNYWLPKLARNKRRDQHVSRELRASGWTVIRFWEHDLASEQRVVARLLRYLGDPAAVGLRPTPARLKPSGQPAKTRRTKP